MFYVKCSRCRQVSIALDNRVTTQKQLGFGFRVSLLRRQAMTPLRKAHSASLVLRSSSRWWCTWKIADQSLRNCTSSSRVLIVTILSRSMATWRSRIRHTPIQLSTPYLAVPSQQAIMMPSSVMRSWRPKVPKATSKDSTSPWAFGRR